MNRTIPLLLVASLAAYAQVRPTHQLGHGVATLESGVTLHYRTMVEASANGSLGSGLGGGVFGSSGNTMRHCLYDRVATTYFGYEMTVLPGNTPDTRKVVFGPVNLAAIREPLKAVAGDLPLNAAPQPKFPPPETVRNGDTIAMDLMTGADHNDRIVDYIQFSFSEDVKPPKADLAEPQDFTIDDGSPSFDLDQTEVSIDGRNIESLVTYPPKGGATLWMYAPGQGRFVLSLAQRPELKKAGVVRGRKISFTWEGHRYEIRLLQAPAGAVKAWNLYVGRDAAWLPRDTLVKSVVMSADRYETLMPHRQ